MKTAGLGRHDMRQLLRRYGSVNVPIFGVGLIVYGTVMILAPERSFGALAYQQGPFLLCGKNWWGAAFVIASILALTIRHLTAIFPLMCVVAGWGIAMMIAAATVDGVSPLAGIYPMMVAVALLVSVAIRGFRPPHLRRARAE